MGTDWQLQNVSLNLPDADRRSVEGCLSPRWPLLPQNETFSSSGYRRDRHRRPRPAIPHFRDPRESVTPANAGGVSPTAKPDTQSRDQLQCDAGAESAPQLESALRDGTLRELTFGWLASSGGEDNF
jgi:hypothetical protein